MFVSTSFVFRMGLTFLGCTLAISSGASAQVFDPGPSDPGLFDNVINLPNDGDIGNFDSISSGTQLNVADDGAVGENFNAGSGSEVNISGGTVGDFFTAATGSEVNISGGTIGVFFRASRFRPGSNVTLFGGDFRFNGVAVTDPTVSLTPFNEEGINDVFTGTLSDGSTFIFTTGADTLSDVTLIATPLPVLDTTPVVIDSEITERQLGLRAGQTLNLVEGGSLRGGFAVIDATLNVQGGFLGTRGESFGSLGSSAEVAGSVVNISGGSVGDFLTAVTGSEVNISGGSVGTSLIVSSSGQVNISGGSVGDSFDVFGGEANISGGSVGDNLFVQRDGVANISGGTVGQRAFVVDGGVVNISGGSVGDFFTVSGDGIANISGGSVSEVLLTRDGSEINFFGSQFLLNGDLLDGLVIDELFTITDSIDTLSGLLADGSSFSFGPGTFASGSTVTVTAVAAVPEPTSMLLLSSLGVLASIRRRRRTVATA